MTVLSVTSVIQMLSAASIRIPCGRAAKCSPNARMNCSFWSNSKAPRVPVIHRRMLRVDRDGRTES
jgi:hypothetical protein